MRRANLIFTHQRQANGHLVSLRATNLFFSIEAQGLQDFLDELRRICRHDSQSVADFIGKSGVLEANLVVTCVFFRTLSCQLAICEQTGLKRVFPGVSSRFFFDRTWSGYLQQHSFRAIQLLSVACARQLAYRLKDAFLPAGSLFLKIHRAIDAFKNSFRAKFLESLIDLLSESAKLFVICIAQSKEGETEIRQRGALLLLQRFPKRSGIVGWIPFSPCTCND